ESFIIPEIDEQHLADLPPEERELAQKTLAGVGSGMGVPLIAHGWILGAVAFYARHKRYSLDDIALAERFAYRVASALANAPLYAQAQQAIRARDEFIAIVSHELRTPLTSLMLTAETFASELDASAPERLLRASQVIVRQTRRLHQLVEHMLDAS